jgi:hypothetical protein
MKKLNENPIDQYFKEVLKSPDLKFNKQDWKGFEKMLPQRPEKKRILWWFPASVAAAILLLFTSLWLINRPDTTQNDIVKVENKSQAEPSKKIKTEKQNNEGLKNADPLLSPSGTLPVNKSHTADHFATAKGDKKTSQDGRSYLPHLFDTKGERDGIAADASAPIPLASLKSLQSETHPVFNGKEISQFNILPPSANHKTGTEKKVEIPPNGRLSLALAFSPDINSVSHFSKSSIGNSIGIGASYRITSRLSASTAIGYSKKVYSAEPYQYKAPWAGGAGKYAESIDADCRVLDIPINLSYSFSKSPKRDYFISAGVSSYFMLNEKYTLIYPNRAGYPSYPDKKYSYSNENQHILNIINLSVGMAKPLGKQTSLVIEPYARLPLTGIGQGKVNLQSVGLNFQLQYNFRKKGSQKATSVNALQ